MSTPSLRSASQTMSPPVSFLPMSLLVSLDASFGAPFGCNVDFQPIRKIPVHCLKGRGLTRGTTLVGCLSSLVARFSTRLIYDC